MHQAGAGLFTRKRGRVVWALHPLPSGGALHPLPSGGVLGVCVSRPVRRQQEILSKFGCFAGVLAGCLGLWLGFLTAEAAGCGGQGRVWFARTGVGEAPCDPLAVTPAPQQLQLECEVSSHTLPPMRGQGPSSKALRAACIAVSTSSTPAHTSSGKQMHTHQAHSRSFCRAAASIRNSKWQRLTMVVLCAAARLV